VNWHNLLNRFGFHKHAPFNQDIEPQRFLTGEPFVLDHHDFLADATQAAKPKFFQHAPLIDRFDQAWAFVSMHFNCRSNNGFRESGCFLV